MSHVWCSGIKDVTGSVSKSGNLELGEEMVQYCYEPVQGDQVRIFPKFSRDFFLLNFSSIG